MRTAEETAAKIETEEEASRMRVDRLTAALKAEASPCISVRELTYAHHAACTCGGAGPDEGCPACGMWHSLMRGRGTP